MANAALAWVNLADAGRLSPSSQVLLMPIRNLQDPAVERRWRSQSNVAFFVADLGASLPIDTVLVRGLTVSTSATVRVRVSSVDTSGAAGDVVDSGTLVSGSTSFDASYGALAYLLPAPLSGRYVRVDISDPPASYVEAGRLFVGARQAFTFNFSWGWQIQYVDRSVQAKTRGGQTAVWIDNFYRTLDLTFELISAAERNGILEAIDRTNLQRTDVLIVTDIASGNLARDSIYGLVSLTPVVSPSFGTDGPIFTKQYKLEERL